MNYNIPQKKWEEISQNSEAVELMKQKLNIENKIRSLDKMALIRLELYLLEYENK